MTLGFFRTSQPCLHILAASLYIDTETPKNRTQKHTRQNTEAQTMEMQKHRKTARPRIETGKR